MQIPYDIVFFYKVDSADEILKEFYTLTKKTKKSNRRKELLFFFTLFF